MSEEIKTRIRDKCHALAQLLCKKNDAYGDSATSPLRVFSNLSVLASIKCRMDDKLSRIQNGHGITTDEDSFWDLAGYLILYQIALEDAAKKDEKHNVEDGTMDKTQDMDEYEKQHIWEG